MKTDRLIRQVQDGDKAALDELIRLHYDKVFSYCYCHTCFRRC